MASNIVPIAGCGGLIGTSCESTRGHEPINKSNVLASDWQEGISNVIVDTDGFKFDLPIL